MSCPTVSNEIIVPDKKLCLEMLDEYGTPPNVISHCQAVTNTAMKIGSGLCTNGYMLNLGLLQAAALLHDIARVEDEHWVRGADIVREKGFPEVAELILPHMTYAPANGFQRIKELDILCLSDRMVKDDKYVGLETRMQFVLDYYKDDPVAFERIKAKIGINKLLRKRIEKIIGKPMDIIILE
ncbi:MAG: HD domain-containing protein [Anaerovoracaceae bacterium]